MKNRKVNNIPSVGKNSPRVRGTRGTPKKGWKPAFLVAFSAGMTVGDAAKDAQIGRSSVYRHLESDPIFAAAFTDAEKQSADALEAEARRRATHGVDEPVIYQGQPTFLYERNTDGSLKTRTVNYTDEQGNTTQKIEPIMLIDADGNPRVLTVRKPSDTLLIFLLKGRRPEVFGDRMKVDGSLGLAVDPVVLERPIPPAAK